MNTRLNVQTNVYLTLPQSFCFTAVQIMLRGKQLLSIRHIKCHCLKWGCISFLIWCLGKYQFNWFLSLVIKFILGISESGLKLGLCDASSTYGAESPIQLEGSGAISQKMLHVDPHWTFSSVLCKGRSADFTRDHDLQANISGSTYQEPQEPCYIYWAIQC